MGFQAEGLLSQLHVFRLGILAVLALSLCVTILRWKQIVRGIRLYFGAETHAVNLAVFRILVFAALLFLGLGSDATWYAGLPQELLYPPPGWSFLTRLPADPTTTIVIQPLFLLACIGGILGYHSRVAAAVAFVSGTYLLGVPQFYGKISHYHHALWFTALIAVSPADHALSIRSISKLPESLSRAYALPLRFAWLLMGIIYFFPGLWKLYHSGPAWLSGAAPRAFMIVEGAYGAPIAFEIFETYPALYGIGGGLTIMFEISFLWLVLFRRTRAIGAFGGIAFHTATWITLGIPFWALQLMYLTFIDWRTVFDRLGLVADPDTIPSALRVGRAPYVVGGFLLYVNFVLAVFEIDSWPFTAYPRFGYLPPPEEFVAPFSCDSWPESRVSRVRLRKLTGRILTTDEPERSRRLTALQTVCGAPK